MIKEAEERVRFLTPEQVDKLLADLLGHKRSMFGICVGYGLRQADVAKLRWESIDRERSVA